MKAMIKRIVVKMLIGVTTTVLTATGIAEPELIDSNQNTIGISAIAAEGVREAEAVADAGIIGGRTDTAQKAASMEESMKTPGYLVNDK